MVASDVSETGWRAIVRTLRNRADEDGSRRLGQRDHRRGRVASHRPRTLPPRGIERETIYAHLKYRGEDFPVAFGLSERVLSLPIFPELSKEQIIYVCDKIKEFYSK